MLEQLFKDPAAVTRWRAGPLGPHLDGFLEAISDLGYTRESIQGWLVPLRDLQRWLASGGLDASALEESLLEQFLGERRQRRRRAGSKRAGAVGARAVHHLLDYLREQGVVAASRPTVDRSPLTSLRRRYADYLRRTRGLAAVTASRYWPFVQCFLVHRFGDGPLRLQGLRADDVSSFLLGHARSSTPGMAKLMVTALRSFFRFLFQAGETRTNLADAVPAIRSWRWSGVPKFLKPEEVQRVINGCDQATAVGRRNRAVLLLIARLGLRASEAIALQLDDIDWRAGVLTIRGKGRFHDRLPIPSEVGTAVAVYLRRDRPQCETRNVFIRARAPHRALANPSTISTIVRRALDQVGLDPPLKGAHVLRHWLATGMLRAGASMAEIGQVLRHRSPNTTEIYAKVDLEGLRSIAPVWPVSGGAG
jgi:site-specific recombinase XerD